MNVRGYEREIFLFEFDKVHVRIFLPVLRTQQLKHSKKLFVRYKIYSFSKISWSKGQLRYHLDEISLGVILLSN